MPRTSAQTQVRATSAVSQVASAQKSIALHIELSAINKKIRSIVEKLSGKSILLFGFAISAVIITQVTIIWVPAIGIYVNTLTLVALIATALRNNTLRNVAISLGIIPAANIVLASIATQHMDALTTTFIYDGILLSVAAIYCLLFALEHKTTAIKISWKQFVAVAPLMIVLGQVIGAIGYVSLRHHVIFSGYNLPILASTVILFACAEELLLRGLIQRQASYVVHPLVAAFGTIALSVALTLGQNTRVTLPVSILLSTVLAITYYKTRRITLTLTLNVVSKLVYVSLLTNVIVR